MTSISTTILSASDMLNSIAKHEASLEDGDDVLHKKNRWIQCSLNNDTQFDIVYNEEYFDSGGYYTKPPTKIDKFTIAEFSVCSTAWLAGVTGGNAWDVILDGNTKFSFGLGFTNPEVGSRKSSAMANAGALDAYEAATEKGANDSSQPYSGKDKNGKEIDFLITVSAASGSHTLFTVRQVQTQGTWTQG